MNDENLYDDEFGFTDDDETEDIPEEVITLISSTGGRFYLPTNGAMTLDELVQKSGLTLGNNIQFFVEDTPIDSGSVIAPNTTVTALGNIKGG